MDVNLLKPFCTCHREGELENGNCRVNTSACMSLTVLTSSPGLSVEEGLIPEGLLQGRLKNS